MPVRPLPCVPHGICRPAEQARQSLSSLSKLSLEDFRNVEQSANAARNAQKAKYQGMLSLYLNVIYQILKKYKPAFEELAKEYPLILSTSKWSTGIGCSTSLLSIAHLDRIIWVYICSNQITK